MTDLADQNTTLGERVAGEDFGTPNGNKRPKVKGKVQCEVCGQECQGQLGLSMHMRKAHNLNIRGEPAPAVSPSSRSSAASDGELRAAAMEFAQFVYGMGGSVLVAFGDPVCGQAVQRSARGCGEAWYQAAKKNRHVRKMLESTGHIGIWGGLILAHWPIIQTAQQHHFAGAMVAGNPPAQPTPQDAGSAYDAGPTGEPVVFDGAEPE